MTDNILRNARPAADQRNQASPIPSNSVPSGPASDSIWIVTGTPSAPGPSLPDGATTRTGKGFHSSHQRPTEPNAQPINTSKLEKRMGQFLHAMGRVFDQAENEAQKKQGLRLTEIELSAEISAEGDVRLIGMAGAKTGGRGAITLTFQRAEE